MKLSNNIFRDVGLSKDNHKLLVFIVGFSMFTMALDLAVALAIPTVTGAVSSITSISDLFSLSEAIVLSISVIIIRPLIGLLVLNAQIRAVLSLLQSIETQIIESRLKDLIASGNWPSERIANIFITHGRYYIDNYLLPFVRALTETASLIAVIAGIFLLFPATAFIFFAVLLVAFIGYKLVIGDIVRRHGHQLLIQYEKFMSLSRGYERRVDALSKSEVYMWKSAIDLKRGSSVMLGVTSQGMKFVVEFTFIVSFSLSALWMLFNEPTLLPAFGASFAYAAVRAIPALTAIMSFIQSADSASHSIKELRLAINRQ